MSEPTVGFALVTFRDVEQALDLVEVLNVMFGDPPISLHHDFAQTALDERRLPGNVRLIPEAFSTGWGTLSTVQAMASTIDHLMSGSRSPDWFYLITAHCYPIKTAAEIRSFLKNTSYDLFMKQSVVFPKEQPHPWDVEMQGRYVKGFARIPFRASSGRRMHKYVPMPGISRPPFSEAFPCRAGTTYYTGNRRAAEELARGMRDRRLLRWYEKRPIVDESLPQTILGNSGIAIAQDDLRYVEWVDPAKEPGEPNPRTLDARHFDRIVGSSGHFARKLMPGRSDELRARIRREVLGI